MAAASGAFPQPLGERVWRPAQTWNLRKITLCGFDFFFQRDLRATPPAAARKRRAGRRLRVRRLFVEPNVVAFGAKPHTSMKENPVVYVSAQGKRKVQDRVRLFATQPVLHSSAQIVLDHCTLGSRAAL